MACLNITGTNTVHLEITVDLLHMCFCFIVSYVFGKQKTQVFAKYASLHFPRVRNVYLADEEYRIYWYSIQKKLPL